MYPKKITNTIYLNGHKNNNLICAPQKTHDVQAFKSNFSLLLWLF